MRQDEGKFFPKVAANAIDNPILSPRYAWMMAYKNGLVVKEICKRFDINRKTFYKWLKRYQESGGDTEALLDRSRRPHHQPRTLSIEVVGKIFQLADETHYGPRRIRRLLRQRHDVDVSERTIWKWLKRRPSLRVNQA